jgi:NADPH2:quinone reductase
MFRNVTLRMILVYLLDPETRRRGVEQITRWLEAGKLDCAVAEIFALEQVVAAHQAVEAGDRLGTVVVAPSGAA